MQHVGIVLFEHSLVVLRLILVTAALRIETDVVLLITWVLACFLVVAVGGSVIAAAMAIGGVGVGGMMKAKCVFTTRLTLEALIHLPVLVLAVSFQITGAEMLI